MDKSSVLHKEPIVNTGDPELIIVTGYSGAGKSTVLKTLEDIGFFCVDNLPIELVDELVGAIYKKHATLPYKKVALGIDVRSSLTVQECIQKIRAVAQAQLITTKVFFLSSSVTVLYKRFQETRRRHPLAYDMTIYQAIEKEATLIEPLASLADQIIDTDHLTLHQLRWYVRQLCLQEDSSQMVVTCLSFGFKYGLPTDANFIFDIRSLPNPYFVPELRSLTGIDQEVSAYLFAQEQVQQYWQQLRSFVQFSLERSLAEGRFFSTVAIGCTGGRHRSVAFVERLKMEDFKHIKFFVQHRDIARDTY